MSPQMIVGAPAIILLLCMVVLGVLAAVAAIKLRDTKEDMRELSSSLGRERERVRKAYAMFSALDPILTTLDVGTLLEWTTKTVRELTRAPYVHVATLADDYHRTEAGEELAASCPTWLHPEIARLVIEGTRGKEIVQKEGSVAGLEHLAAMPLTYGDGESIGAVIVGKWPSEDEGKVLQELSGRVAKVLEANLRWAPGGRDPLTGLPNSASLVRVLRRKRHGEIAILLADPRGLGTYHDIRGMDAGDRLLRDVAQELEARGFKAFRYRDDVFAIILRGYDQARIRKAAEEIQGLLMRLTEDDTGEQEACVGYCMVGSESEDAEHALEVALEALERAKGEPERIARALTDDDTEDQKVSEAAARQAESFRMAEALVVTMESKSPYTGRHMRAVAEVAELIGFEMGLTHSKRETLFVGALLHDVGKIGVPDAILNKRGPLTLEEYKLLKEHPLTGDNILKPLGETLAAASPAVRHHHERYDGSGYPDGLTGEEIPFLARVVFVADAFDSMVRDRPYRRGISTETASQQIAANAGSQFDPAVVKAFLRVIEMPSTATGESPN